MNSQRGIDYDARDLIDPGRSTGEGLPICTPYIAY